MPDHPLCIRLWPELEHAKLRYWPQALSPADADKMLDTLRDDIVWQQRSIMLWGRPRQQPRLIAWHGDAPYRYSGLLLEPEPWTPTLQALRLRCESLCGARFNSVLLNRYRSGHDHMGWHRDNERELGTEPVIASLSFGVEREFQLRPLNQSGTTPKTLLPAHGSLLEMAGETQQHYQHRLRQQKRLTGERINLTFRWVEA